MSSTLRHALERHRGVVPERLDLLAAREQVLVAVEIERGEARGAGQRMRRIGVAVEELHDMLRPVHEGVVDALAADHAAHRHDAGGHALGEGDHVGDDAVALGGEGVAEPAEAGDDLVEDQQDAVLVADRAQPLQIALRRRQHRGRAGHRLDDDGGDGGVAVQRDDALQLVGQMRAPFRLALGERLLLAVVGVRQMIDARQHRAERLAVVGKPADRHAAEADAVIAALAADEARALALALRDPIGQRDLQRGVGGLRAGVAEEHVVEVARRQRRDPARQLEGARMAELEGRREVELGRLLLDRLDDRIAVVAGVGAPQAGGGVEHRAALRRVVVHVLGAGDQPRPRLEGAIGGERHEEGFEVVRRRSRDARRCAPAPWDVPSRLQARPVAGKLTGKSATRSAR